MAAASNSINRITNLDVVTTLDGTKSVYRSGKI